MDSAISNSPAATILQPRGLEVGAGLGAEFNRFVPSYTGGGRDYQI